MSGGTSPRPTRLLPGLAVTETVSWGICYYGFAVLVPAGGIVLLASSNGAATAWLALGSLGIGQGTSTLLRPLVPSRRLDPLVYGLGAIGFAVGIAGAVVASRTLLLPAPALIAV